MSYTEKPEDITREEWMEKLNNVHIQRADMNRLIMNYLVTGEVPILYYSKFVLGCLLKVNLQIKAMYGCTMYRVLPRLLFHRGLQGGS